MLVIEYIKPAEQQTGTALATQPLRDGGYSVTCSDLLADGSGRSAETGIALRYPVRKGVFKLNLKFKGKSADIAQVDGLVSAFTQEVKFRYAGEWYIRNFYPSDRNMNDNGMTADLSVNLIEI